MKAFAHGCDKRVFFSLHSEMLKIFHKASKQRKSASAASLSYMGFTSGLYYSTRHCQVTYSSQTNRDFAIPTNECPCRGLWLIGTVSFICKPCFLSTNWSELYQLLLLKKFNILMFCECLEAMSSITHPHIAQFWVTPCPSELCASLQISAGVMNFMLFSAGTLHTTNSYYTRHGTQLLMSGEMGEQGTQRMRSARAPRSCPTRQIKTENSLRLCTTPRPFHSNPPSTRVHSLWYHRRHGSPKWNKESSMGSDEMSQLY